MKALKMNGNARFISSKSLKPISELPWILEFRDEKKNEVHQEWIFRTNQFCSVQKKWKNEMTLGWICAV